MTFILKAIRWKLSSCCTAVFSRCKGGAATKISCTFPLCAWVNQNTNNDMVIYNAWTFFQVRRRSIITRKNAVNILFTFFIINSNVLLLLSNLECSTFSSFSLTKKKSFTYILSVTVFSRKCIHTRNKKVQNQHWPYVMLSTTLYLNVKRVD